MRPIYSLLVGSLLLGFTACEKDLHLPTDVANITVVHAIVDVPTLVVKTSGKQGVWKALTDSFTGKVSYGAVLGNPLKTATAKNLKIASATDTMTTLYQAGADFAPAPGDLYTLFLSGNAVSPESVLIKENLIAQPDSISGVRFVNLAQNNRSIKINIRNSAANEVSELKYLQYTDFKTYPADLKHSNYVFEFRDEVTGNLLFTYTFVVARTYNVSLVLRGTNTLAVTRVNHY